MLLSFNDDYELREEYCDFLKLDINSFIEIQNNLLLKQIELLKSCSLGKKLLRGNNPITVEEFRKNVPLTNYDDYFAELVERREDILPAKPVSWVRTSGRSGNYPAKWIPITAEYKQHLAHILFCLLKLASYDERHKIPNLPVRLKVLNVVAPRPYMSGAMMSMLDEIADLDIMPPIEGMDNFSFEERIAMGFRQALSQGLDCFFGLSLVLVKVGEKISQASISESLLPLIKQPKVFARLFKGLLKSKLAGRQILPRDLWNIKGILSGGLDSWVYRDKIKELWGRYPLDVYAGTEGGIYATQTWDFDAMTFIPNLNFLEFIPEEEHFKWQIDHHYEPKTVLLNEVKPGEHYELVITNFHGGILVRYRIGDMIKITSLKNEKTNINLPQMVFESRIDDLFDFFGMHLNERVIWQAIESLGIAYEDWIAYKEPGQTVLNILIELKSDFKVNDDDLAARIYKELLKLTGDEYTQTQIHDELQAIDFKVNVSILTHGTFAQYTRQKQAEGADLAHLKPPHINPSDKTINLLLSKRRIEKNIKTKIELTSESS